MNKAWLGLALALCSLARAGAVEDAVEQMNRTRDANTHIEMVRPGVYYDPLKRQYMRIEERRSAPRQSRREGGVLVPVPGGGYLNTESHEYYPSAGRGLALDPNTGAVIPTR